jgi:hypothetical protein
LDVRLLYTYAPPIRILSENIVLTNIFYNLAVYKIPAG